MVADVVLGLRAAILVLYIASALAVYAGRDLGMVHQITWIPIIEYLAVFLIAGIIGGGLWVARRISRVSRETMEAV